MADENTEITPETVGAAIGLLVSLLGGDSAEEKPEEAPLSDDEIAALKARGYDVTKAEKAEEKPEEKSEEKPLSDDEIAALKARGYDVTKAEKAEEKPLSDDEIAALKARGYDVAKVESKPEEKPGAKVTGITNVTDLLKVAAERSSAKGDSPSKYEAAMAEIEAWSAPSG